MRWQEGHLGSCPVALLACGAIAGADGEPIEPGVESGGVAQPADVAPCGDQRVLDGIVREFGVTENQVGDPIEAWDRGRGELGECCVIAG